MSLKDRTGNKNASAFCEVPGGPLVELMYTVIDTGGQHCGPVDFRILREWAADGRLCNNQLVQIEATGETVRAWNIPGLLEGLAFFWVGDEKRGPMAFQELQSLKLQGVITEMTRMENAGTGAGFLAGEWPELFPQVLQTVAQASFSLTPLSIVPPHLFVEEGDSIHCIPGVLLPGPVAVRNCIRDAGGKITAQLDEETSFQEFFFSAITFDWKPAIRFKMSSHLERLGSNVLMISYQKSTPRPWWVLAMISVPRGEVWLDDQYPYYEKTTAERILKSPHKPSKAATTERRRAIADLISELLRHREWYVPAFTQCQHNQGGRL